MNILLCGADGMLGRHLGRQLEAAGHRVVRGVHRPRLPGDLALDYRCDLSPEAWLPRLAGIDAVINAVGILRETRAGDYQRIHHQAPAALFAACARAGITRVVQISALGQGDAAGLPAYLDSKRAADAALVAALPQGATVLRPGLVFAPDGASSRFFLALASLPLLALPGGAGPVQPVHVDDLAAAVLACLEQPTGPTRVLELPGPRALSYRDWLQTYRRLQGLASAPCLPLPAWLMPLAARVAGFFPGSLLSADSWRMLAAGNLGDPAPATTLLGRPLRDPEAFAPPAAAPQLLQQSLACWRPLLLRGVLAAIWLSTALLSAGLYPLQDSLALLAPFGLQSSLALAVLGSATLLDAGLGLLTLLRPGQRLWWAQLALVGAYTILIAWQLPAFLLHPFGPILKNLAVAALLVQLLAEEQKP